MERGLSWDLYVYAFFILFEIGCKGSWPILTKLTVLYLWMF